MGERALSVYDEEIRQRSWAGGQAKLAEATALSREAALAWLEADRQLMMLRRGDGETQRQMRFADTKWPEQLSATWVFGRFSRTAASWAAVRVFRR